MKRVILAIVLAMLVINVFNKISNQVSAYQLFKVNNEMVEKCTFDMLHNPDLICD